MTVRTTLDSEPREPVPVPAPVRPAGSAKPAPSAPSTPFGFAVGDDLRQPALRRYVVIVL